MSTTFVGGKSLSTKGDPLPLQNPIPAYTYTYTRPADWLTLPSVSTSDEKFVGLFAVKENGPNFVAFTFSGAYTVDWGDGTPTENIAANTQANHNYDWANISGSTVTSKGYRQAIITVTPQAGQHLASLDIFKKYNLTAPEGGTINTYGVGWLDIRVGSPYLTSCQFGNNSGVIVLGLLEQIEIVKVHPSSGLTLFNGVRSAIALKNFIFSPSAGFMSSCPSAFLGCSSLINAPDMDLQYAGDVGGMFQNCTALRTVPAYNIGLATNASNMFNGCVSLETVPKFTTGTSAQAYNFSSMFQGCTSLVNVPDDVISYTTATGFNLNSMFSGCKSLVRAPKLNMGVVTTANSMFVNCVGLKQVPSYSAPIATSVINMFQGCVALEYAPKMSFPTTGYIDFLYQGCTSLKECDGIFTTGNLISAGNTFQNCYALISAPFISNIANVTTFTSVYQNCSALTSLVNFENAYNSQAVVNSNMYTAFSNCVSLNSVANINHSKVLNSFQMYFNCADISSVDSLNLSNATSTANMFDGCKGLISFTNANMVSASNIIGMFSNCSSLTNVSFTQYSNSSPAYAVNGLFNQCISLTSAPSTNLQYANNVAGMFTGCSGLVSIPAYNLANLTVSPSTWCGSANTLANIAAVNTKLAVSYTNLNLSRTTLNQVMDNLGSPATTQILTISTNPGADTPVTSNLTAGQAAGSTTLTVASSASFTVGMWVTNSVCFADTAVTFQDAGDTVTKTSHGLSNGTRVSFPTIVTTTGITVYTIYYVVNSTANTFQVEATVGGGALPLTNNGTGTLRYEVYVTGKPSGTQVTISAPTTAITTATALSGRNLNTYRATLKNWTVTG